MSAVALDAGAGAALYPAVQALLALVAVLGLVWYARRALSGSALLGKRGERLKLEERLALDLRNSLVIVRVDQRRLLLATSANGTARLITELSEGQPHAELHAARHEPPLAHPAEGAVRVTLPREPHA